MNDSVDEMKLINESDIIYLQIDSAKYHYSTELLQFYY